MKILAPIAALAILLSSCFTVEFAEPQPQGMQNLSTFPEEMVGTYRMFGDSLFIKSKSFLRSDVIWNETIALIDAQSDSNLRFMGDVLVDNRIGDDIRIPYTIEHDTVKYHYHTYEEVFISDSLILRKFKKYTVLNLKVDGKWEVWLLRFQKSGSLTADKILGDDYPDGRDFSTDSLVTVISDVCEVARVSDDEYVINPTKSEFKKLVRRGVFRPYFEFKKID